MSQPDLPPLPGDEFARRFQPKKFGDEAARVIRELIFSGQIGPERLNEVSLSQRLGISRSPIREALNALAGDGLVSFVPGRGAFVPEFDRDQVRQLGEARRALECAAAELAATRRSGADLREMASLLERTTNAIAESSGQYPYTLDFHGLVLRCSGNSVIEQLAASVNGQLKLSRVVSGQNPKRAREALIEHHSIYEALRRGDPEAAGAAMFEHLSHALVSAEHLMSAQSPAVVAPLNGPVSSVSLLSTGSTPVLGS